MASEDNASSRAPDVAGFPLRALWAWPLGCALIGTVEAVIQSGRIGGGGVGPMVLAVFAAASVGVWPGVLALLVAILLGRRGLDPGRRIAAFVGDWSTPLITALLVAVVGWQGVQMIHDLFQVRHFDFVEESVEVWRALIVVGLPPAVLVTYVLMRRLEDRFATTRAWKLLGRAALTASVVWAIGHLSRGPFVLHFGKVLPLAMVLAAVIATAVWLPRQLAPGRRGQLFGLVPLLVVAGLGWVGFRHPVARALLLHDTRGFPVLHSTAFAFADRDGDGETGAWAGGADCDDSDPDVASWQPEHPGNGKDDNCRLGDATSIPSAPTATLAGPPRHRPIVLITLDTINARYLDLYGYPRATMPYLTQYAEGAAWFRRAYSPSNHTGFSIISMLSGQGPEFLIHDPQVRATGGKKFSHWLPHTLGRLGYDTWAINPTLVGTDISLDQLRFEHFNVGPFEYAPTNTGTRAKQIADWIPTFLDKRPDDEPLFAWIHIADAHAAHEANPHFPGDATTDGYDNELRWVDLHLATILGAVHNLYGDDVIVVITSDHGEEFGEFGAWGHGYSLREGMLRVPLIIRAPGVDAGPVDRPVNVAGVPATILELIREPASERITVPSVLVQEDLPVVVGAPFFLDEARMDVALIESRYKLIRNRKQGTSLLFDLESDPDETRNLAGDDPAALERMQASLDQALELLR